MRTTNSGASWTDETLPPDYYMGGIACPSASTCVSVNQASTVRTTNGGRSWVGSALPTGAADVGAIACPSTSVCEAVSQDSGLALRTTNGGRSWVSRSFKKIGAFYDFACPSTSVCEAIGESTVTGYEEALRTTNGGRSWAAQNIPDGLGAIERDCLSYDLDLRGGGRDLLINGHHAWRGCELKQPCCRCNSHY